MGATESLPSDAKLCEICYRLLFNRTKKTELVEEMLQHEFKRWDSDSNGFVSFDEFRQTAAVLGIHFPDEKLLLFMKKFDKNCDDTISYAEFVDFLGLSSTVGELRPTPPSHAAGVQSPRKAKTLLEYFTPKQRTELKHMCADGSAGYVLSMLAKQAREATKDHYENGDICRMNGRLYRVVSIPTIFPAVRASQQAAAKALKKVYKFKMNLQEEIRKEAKQLKLDNKAMVVQIDELKVKKTKAVAKVSKKITKHRKPMKPLEAELSLLEKKLLKQLGLEDVEQVSQRL
jgi:hypothetical protein